MRFVLLLALATATAHADDAPADACTKILNKIGGEIFQVSWRDFKGARFFSLDAGRATIGFVRFKKLDADDQLQDTKWAPHDEDSLHGQQRRLNGYDIFISLTPMAKERMREFTRGAERCLGR